MPGNPVYINGAPKANPPAPDPAVPHFQGSTLDSVTPMQQFLKNRGYNIAVDGIRGPETNRAVLAFHKKIPPSAFNAGRKVAPSSAPPAHTDASNRVPAATPAPAVVPPGKGSGGKPPSRVPAGAPAVDPATGQLIDPAAYAHGVANSQYDPQINELIRQLTQGRADEGSHTKQIQAWYDQAMAAMQGNATADATAGQHAEQGYDNANANILDLFGGPDSNKSTAAEAAAFHDIGAGNLRSDVNSQAQFDKNLQSVEAVRGTESQKAQFNADQQNLKDIASKVVDLRGAKGSAYAAAYQQGTQNRTQQEAAQQQLALAKALAPAQIKQANANATAATVNASTAAANAKTNLALARLRLKQGNAALAAASASNGGHWDLTLPQQQGALQKALETNIYGPKGGLAINPETAWANLQQQLQMNGLADDPHAQALAQGTFLQGLWTSHSAGNFGGYAWNGKKVVRTGNAYKVDKKTGTRSLINSKGKAIPDYKPYRR